MPNGKYENIRVIADPMDRRYGGFYLQVISNKFPNPIKKEITDMLNTSFNTGEDQFILVDKLFEYCKTIARKHKHTMIMNEDEEF